MSINVKDHGVIGNGTTNDTAAIQSVINTYPGQRIYFPAGTYRVTSPIKVLHTNTNLVGDGEGATKIRSTVSSGDIFVVGSSTVSVHNVLIEGFYFEAAPAKTSGAAIHVLNSHNIRIKHVRFGYDLNISVHFAGGPDQYLYYLSDFEINSGTIGILIDGYAQDVWINTGLVAACTGPGVWLKHCSGVYMDSVGVLNCYNGMQLIPYANETVRLCFFNQVIADTCSGNGWELSTVNGGKVIGMNLSNCWGSSTTTTAGAGFVTTGIPSGEIRGLALTNFRAMSNRGHGIDLKHGEGITLTNCQATGNSIGSAGNYSGIHIDSSLTDFSIIGGVSGNRAADGSAATQAFGVHIESGCTRYSVMGVNLAGNARAPMADQSVSGTVYGNPGYVTTANGDVEVPVGVTYVNVAHGMSIAPAVRDIIVWAETNIALSGVNNWWVSNVTDTHFRLNVNNAPNPHPVWLGWRATRHGS